MPNEFFDSSHSDPKNSDPCSYHFYSIETDPTKTIEFVQFDYTCRFCLDTLVRLYVNYAVTDSRNLTECPCTWKLNRKVKHLELIATKPLYPECMMTEVIYQQMPEEWMAITPGTSYLLPTEPADISKISFEAKTNPGTTSEITLFLYDFPLNSAAVTETQRAFEFVASGGPFPISVILLTNSGSSTIYIRNLTTE